jgi:hypothetical protein
MALFLPNASNSSRSSIVLAALLLLLLLGAAFSGCGKGSDDSYEDDRTRPEDGDGDGIPGDKDGDGNSPGDEPGTASGVLRARWEIDVASGIDGGHRSLRATGARFATKGSATQGISATVAAAVTFTVDVSNFQNAVPTSGVTSFGSLDVTALRDNALRVCGNGNQKCTSGTIRVYTSGTAGDGLWSDVEGYGLPIKTGASVIGLGAANAVTASTTTFGANVRVLKLADFTSSPALVIPVSVDFTDAAAASYSSTLVVEYVLN